MQTYKGIVLFAMVFLLSGVFVLQFGGPQAEGCAAAPVAAAAEVYGHPIVAPELRSAFLLARDRFPSDLARQYQMERMVLDGLVEERLLAREAQKLGYAVTEDEVIDNLVANGIVYVAMSVDANAVLPPAGPRRYKFTDDDDNFSQDNLKGFINNALRRSVRDFAQSQTTATLAQRMRETLLANVSIGDGEVWSAYVREQENVVLKYARFSPLHYAQKLDASEENIAAWMAAHTAEVDAEYDRQKHRYTGLEKQVRASHILIKVSASATDEEKQAARARIDALLASAKAGEDFAALATEHSEDPGSGAKGGDLGFNPKGRMVKPFDEAQFAMEPGQVSDVVESTFGLHIIKVVAIREGDVPVDEAKLELAERLFRDSRAGELAEAAAKDALASLKAGTTVEALEAAWAGRSPAAAGEAAAGGEDAAEEPPAPADPMAPQFRDTRPFGRSDTPIPGPFDSAPLVKAAFELTEDASLPGKPMKLGDSYFVFRLQSKSVAEQEKFTADERQRIEGGLLNGKRREVLVNYVHELVADARDKQQLVVDASAVAETPSVPL